MNDRKIEDQRAEIVQSNLIGSDTCLIRVGKIGFATRNFKVVIVEDPLRSR